MPTVSQVARIARTAANTVRNYARDYPDLFSEGARGLQGARIFNQGDVEVVCSIVALKNSGLTLAEAVERLRSQEAPPVIDVAATPLQDAASSLQAPQASLMALSGVLTRLDALERAQQRIDAERATERRNDKLQGAMWGVIVGLSIAALYWWTLYLAGG